MYYYFLFVCSFLLGFFKIPYGMVNDIIFIPLIFYILKNWKVFTRLDKPSKALLICWSLFTLYYTFLLLTTDKFNSAASVIFNIRGMYPFLFTYLTVIIINTKSKLFKFIRFLLLAGVIATVIAVVQSIYGLEPMFDPKKFYNIGHWAGQGNKMIGPIARVMLPTLYLVIMLFICAVIYKFFNSKSRNFLHIFIFLIPVLISYARGMWLAIVLSIIITLFLLMRKKILNVKALSSTIIYLVMAGFILSMFISKKNDIALSIADRFTTGISEFVNKNGTYGTRLDESQVFLVKWYTTGFYSGIDPFYEQRNEATTLADVGYVYVLVSTGLIGLVLLALIWLSGIWFSLHSMNLLVKAKLKKYTIFPACFLAVILFFIVSQLYIQYNFIITVLAIAYGLAISTKKIFYDQVSIKK